MAKGQFKIKNIDNLTTEQVKGKPLNYQINNGEIVPMGIITHADENYVYGEFEHSGDGELIINFESEKCSMELRGD